MTDHTLGMWIVVMLSGTGEPIEAYGPVEGIDNCYRLAGAVSRLPNDWMPIRITRAAEVKDLALT